MPATETYQQFIDRYLQDIIAAERGLASQLEELASDTGDDEEVRIALVESAEQARVHADDVAARLDGDSATVKDEASRPFASMSKLAHLGHIQEERIVQNLIAGYTAQMAACGNYCALQASATAAADATTARLAAQCIAGKQKLAERLFHFIPTRAIIAYNMLTVNEIDLAIETKYGERSWTG
jgi:ferritin-like metal-binding protein YciE